MVEFYRLACRSSPTRKKYSDRIATLLPDGRIEVDVLPFAGPTEAATYIAGKQICGWWFFLTDQTRNVRFATFVATTSKLWMWMLKMTRPTKT